MSNWGPWSKCDRECGYGAQYHTRVAITPQSLDGSACPCSEAYRPCYIKDCCPECTLTPWSAWEPCTATCDGGTSSRRRYVNTTTPVCDKTACEELGLLDIHPCNTAPCPQPCVMSDWSAWSSCSSECGLGFAHHTRSVVTYGNGRCLWDFEEIPCNNGDCVVPCVYTGYTDWSPCLYTCVNSPEQAAANKQYRSKFRISGDGVSCPAVISDTPQQCNSPACPVNCQVSDWTEGNCSAQYGWGQKIRTRTITVNPSAGNLCPQLTEINRCFITPPNDTCLWSLWSTWEPCPVTCNDGSGTPMQIKERVLLRGPTTPDPANPDSVILDVNQCGDAYLRRACQNIPPCPINCVMTKWSVWSECVSPGVRYRTRTAHSQPQFGGTPCPLCIKEVDKCVVPQNQVDVTTCTVQPCLALVQAEKDQASTQPTFAA